jgi:hypothetical protein
MSIKTLIIMPCFRVLLCAMHEMISVFSRLMAIVCGTQMPLPGENDQSL